MDALRNWILNLDWSIGVLAALGAALLIARGARIRASDRAAERDRKMQRVMPPPRGR
ncbi:MAG: hypothetical protein JNK46_15135 [Methylobacteriaceae bacterium]|nr:hypothetical protein [Methylobacteriaceae bacterium]